MDMKLIIIALVLLCGGAKNTTGTTPELRTGISYCRTITPMKPFDVEKFSGLWYPVYVPRASFSLKCWQISFVVSTLLVQMTDVRYDMETGTVCSIKVESFVPLDDSGAMRFSASVWRNRSSVYVSVLDTDYNNYAVVNICFPKGAGKNRTHLLAEMCGTGCGYSPTSQSDEHAFMDDFNASENFPMHFIWRFSEFVYVAIRTPLLSFRYIDRINDVLASLGEEDMQLEKLVIQDCGQYSCEDENADNCFYPLMNQQDAP